MKPRRALDCAVAGAPAPLAPSLAPDSPGSRGTDFEHPGFNNNYLVNTGDPLAVLYNDRSPLESHHVAASWRALREPRYNFLEGLPRSDLKDLRKTVIDMVLATDMSQHFEILGAFKKRAAAGFLPPGAEPPIIPPASFVVASGPGSRRASRADSISRVHPQPTLKTVAEAGGEDGLAGSLSRPVSAASLTTQRLSAGPGAGALGTARRHGPTPPKTAAPQAPGMGTGIFSPGVSSHALVPLPLLPPSESLQADDRRLILSMAIKACDIGHGAKRLDLHVDWSRRVSAEFYNQGDQERAQGLEVSPLMDRNSANLPRSQIGFFDFICLPSYEALVGVLPALRETFLGSARRNYAHWQELAAAAAAGLSPTP
eukprot:tig00021742_g23311.t1